MKLSVEDNVSKEIESKGYAWISASKFSISRDLDQSRKRLWSEWSNLRVDGYLHDNAKFRLRRYGRFYLEGRTGEVLPLADAPYFQSTEDNTYAGGIDRQFEGLTEATVNNDFLKSLIYLNFKNFPTTQMERDASWEIGVHLFRIVTTPSEVGLPTPEGMHHDGNDYFSVHLVDRSNITGGDTEIYDNDQRLLERRLLSDSMDTLLVRDPDVMHAVTPITLTEKNRQGVRDALVIDYFHRPLLQRPRTSPREAEAVV